MAVGTTACAVSFPSRGVSSRGGVNAVFAHAKNRIAPGPRALAALTTAISLRNGGSMHDFIATAEERVVQREQLVTDLMALRDRLLALPDANEHRVALLKANARMIQLAGLR